MAKEPVSRPSGGGGGKSAPSRSTPSRSTPSGGGKSTPSRSTPSRSVADRRDDRPPTPAARPITPVPKPISGGRPATPTTRPITPVTKPISGGRPSGGRSITPVPKPIPSAPPVAPAARPITPVPKPISSAPPVVPVASPISGGGIKDVRAQQLMTDPLAPVLSAFPQRPGQTTGTMLSVPGQLPDRVNPVIVEQPSEFPPIPESVIDGVDPETIAAMLPLAMRPSAYDYTDTADAARMGTQRLLADVFFNRPTMPTAPAPMTPPAFDTSPKVGGAIPQSVADAGRMMGINEIPAMSRPAAPAVLPSIADAGRMMGVNDIPAISQPAVRNYVGSGATPLSGEPYLNYAGGNELTQAGINQMERAGLDVRGISPGDLPTIPELDRMMQTGYADPVFRMGAPTTDLGGTPTITPATQTGGGATMSPGAIGADAAATAPGTPPALRAGVVPGSLTSPGLGLLAGVQNLLSGGFRDAMSGLFGGEFRDTRSPEQRASDWFAAQREMDRGSDRVSAAPIIPVTDDSVLEDMPSPTMPTDKPAWWPDYLPWPPRQTAPAPVPPTPVPPLPTAPSRTYSTSYAPMQSAISAGLAGMPMRFG